MLRLNTEDFLNRLVKFAEKSRHALQTHVASEVASEYIEHHWIDRGRETAI
jgi:hypothetical protein